MAEINATDGAIDLAETNDLPLHLMRGSGEAGRVLKGDVQAFKVWLDTRPPGTTLTPKDRHKAKMEGVTYKHKLVAVRFIDFFTPGQPVPDAYYDQEQVTRMLAGRHPLVAVAPQ